MIENISVAGPKVLADEFKEYSQSQKTTWAKTKAQENAKYLSSNLGYDVSDRLPYVLLQAATEVLQSVEHRNKLKTRICERIDHYSNTMKVLATAIIHYDLASNLVGVRDRVTHKLERCENSLFASRLDMPPRTVDNCIYTLKRAGLYLSFEQREEKDSDTGPVYRGVASIKRLNMVIFEMLGLGNFVTVQRAKAKQRKQIKLLAKTPEQEQLDSYRGVDDKVRAKRNSQRSKAKLERNTKPLSTMLAAAQAKNRTEEILSLSNQGFSHEEIKAIYQEREQAPILIDDGSDIPY